MSASVLYMSVSLDGYIAGPHDEPSNPGGDGFARLLAWFVTPDGAFFRPAGELLDELNATGAVVVGRRTAEQVDHWGGQHHGVPIFVPSHRPPGPSVAHYPLVTYVTDGIASAMAQAKRRPMKGMPMDPKFHSAVAAIKAGDLERIRTLLREDPSLATARSSKSHPTLLQCVVLDGFEVPHSVEVAQLLIDAGAPVDEPLIAAASMDNVAVIPVLLDAGAAINGNGTWSPLEDALAFGAQRAIKLLLERGATVHNLRIAAGLGRVDLIDGFFHPDGRLRAEAGTLAWPFGEPAIGWSQDPQDLIDNAFVYACRSGQIAAVERLLQHGARINAIPPGFDYAGTGLHYAAMDGHLPLVEYLLAHGADPRIKDRKVRSTPAGWADHGGHPIIKALLERAEQGE